MGRITEDTVRLLHILEKMKFNAHSVREYVRWPSSHNWIAASLDQIWTSRALTYISSPTLALHGHYPNHPDHVRITKCVCLEYGKPLPFWVNKRKWKIENVKNLHPIPPVRQFCRLATWGHSVLDIGSKQRIMKPQSFLNRSQHGALVSY